MTKIFVLKRRRIAGVAIVLIAALAAGYWIYGTDSTLPVFGNAQETRVYDMAAIEFSSTLPDGTEIETYQWYPGTIYAKKGDSVELRIRGIHGESHPFIIEGMQIKEEVRKGEETIVRFEATEKGIFKLICLTHQDGESHGPMVAHIVVD